MIPAPKGTGLKIEGECAKILKLAGIKDVWSKTMGKTSTKLNLIYACFEALKKLMNVKTKGDDVANLGIVEGGIKKQEKDEEFIEEIKAKPEKKEKKEETK